MPSAGALAVLSALLVGAEVALGAHGHLPPGTFAAAGVGGCVALVVVSKWLGKHWLQRPEDDA